MKLPNDEIVHYKSDDGVTCIIERTELVRCKDCKFWDSDCRWCDLWGDTQEYDDGYCSYGERKDGDSDE